VFSKNNNARTTAKETEWPGEEKRNSCIYLEQLKKEDGNEELQDYSTARQDLVM